MEIWNSERIMAGEEEQTPEVMRWLCVSGDIDDFIYYGEEPKQSER